LAPKWLVLGREAYMAIQMALTERLAGVYKLLEALCSQPPRAAIRRAPQPSEE